MVLAFTVDFLTYFLIERRLDFNILMRKLWQR